MATEVLGSNYGDLDLNSVLRSALADLMRANLALATAIGDLKVTEPVSSSDDCADLEIDPTVRDVAEDVAVFANRVRFQSGEIAKLVRDRDIIQGEDELPDVPEFHATHRPDRLQKTRRRMS